MKSEKEIRKALKKYRENKSTPNAIANKERRRALLWVLGEDESSIDYSDPGLPPSFQEKGLTTDGGS